MECACGRQRCGNLSGMVGVVVIDERTTASLTEQLKASAGAREGGDCRDRPLLIRACQSACLECAKRIERVVGPWYRQIHAMAAPHKGGAPLVGLELGEV